MPRRDPRWWDDVGNLPSFLTLGVDFTIMIQVREQSRVWPVTSVSVLGTNPVRLPSVFSCN